MGCAACGAPTPYTFCDASCAADGIHYARCATCTEATYIGDLDDRGNCPDCANEDRTLRHRIQVHIVGRRIGARHAAHARTCTEQTCGLRPRTTTGATR